MIQRINKRFLVENMDEHSFDIGRYIVLPGRKVLGIILTAKPYPVVLESISKIARDVNVVILYVSFSTIKKGQETIKAIGFMDFTNATEEPLKVIKRLKDLEYVEDVKIIHPIFDGFIGDIYHHKLFSGNERVFFLGASGFKKLVEELNKLGAGGKAILYNIGYDIGKGYAESYRKSLQEIGIKDDVKEIVEKVTICFTRFSGLGKGEIVKESHNPIRIIFRIYDNYECEVVGYTGDFNSHFVRGMIAGVVEEIYNKKVLVVETKCISRGDPYCEFLITERE